MLTIILNFSEPNEIGRSTRYDIGSQCEVNCVVSVLYRLHVFARWKMTSLLIWIRFHASVDVILN